MDGVIMGPKSKKSIYSFIKKDAYGNNQYGTGLIFCDRPVNSTIKFLEKYRAKDISILTVQKCICICSQYSFTNKYCKILRRLRKQAMTPMDIPFEVH